MSKGSKRRPCCIPSWLEVFRWMRATSGLSSACVQKTLETCLEDHPDDRKYLTNEELELLYGNV